MNSTERKVWMIWESFFDDKLDELSNFSLWKPNNPTLGLETAPVLFRGYLMKVDKSSEGRASVATRAEKAFMRSSLAQKAPLSWP